MANITNYQKQQIRTLTRRANRRIERAKGGQASALTYYAKKMTGAEKFSAATSGMSYEQAEAQLRALNKFLEAKSTTITGWREIKAENVRKANETLGEQGYDLTDQELAEILKQIDSADRKEFYRAINLVQANKVEEGDAWKGSGKQIAEAIAQKATAQQALERSLEARNTREK